MAGLSAGKIRILLFAGLREQAGWAEQQWSADATRPAPLTPRQLWQALQLPGELSRVRIAIKRPPTWLGVASPLNRISNASVA